MQELLSLFPFIQETMSRLENQNKYLNKVTLTGKINALHVAANLFDFVEKTALVFDELKVELVHALLEENLKKVTNELDFKAKTTIDILIRNLFERTADVGFFSQDSLICDFLTSQKVSHKQMLLHLQEYASKYTVYNEIVIFDTEGKAQINLNPQNHILKSNDVLLQEALKSESYIECYKHTDIFSSQSKTLLYAQKIVQNSQVIGVLCLCFKFEDEMQKIFKQITTTNETLLLCNSQEILASTNTSKYKRYQKNDYTVEGKSISVQRKATPYQGYEGIGDWFATATLRITPPQRRELVADESTPKHTSKFLSDALKDVIEKANDIVEDIADVIINGELIAAKQRVYVLTPILDNMRNISTELLSIIEGATHNLEEISKDGLLNDAKSAAHLAIDIMDRNLYERANDCRWWALTPQFQEELSKPSVDVKALTHTLAYINELYTVYTNIFIFNANAEVIATSKDDTIVGEKLQGNAINATLRNKDSQKYFVSDFEATALYEEKATYIYSASIVANGKTVGGIGVVFDAEPEFKAILQDTSPLDTGSFMLFVDKDKKVIATHNSDIELLSLLDIEDTFVTKESATVSKEVIFKGKEYIISSVYSQGYREYKREDNYTNDVFCLCFIAL